MRFGVIGAGRIGKIHAANIAARPDCEVAYVADVDAAAAAALAESTGARGRRDRRDRRRRAPIDAVAICAPTDMHADLIERAARAGKAIFCEKPIDLDASAHPPLPRSRRQDRRAADGRLQSPFRPEFRRAAGAARRRRDRRGRRSSPITSRDPGAAADLLHRALGRPVSRHDDPRFRHGALPARRGADRRQRDGLVSGRQGDRRSGRRRHRRRRSWRPSRASSPRSPIRAARPTATTSASRRTAPKACSPPATCARRRSSSPAPRASSPTRSSTSSSSVMRGLSVRARRLRRRGRGRPQAVARAARTGLPANRLADAAYLSWRESGGSRSPEAGP